MTIATQFKPADLNLTVEGSGDWRIINLSMPNQAQEYSQVLTNNVRSITIKSRLKGTLNFATVSGETTTNYLTIPAGSSMTLTGLTLSSKTIYLQSSKANDIIEILETY